MRPEVEDMVPLLASLGALLLALAAFSSLPLLGGLAGALVAGGLAGLLARDARAAASAALLAGGLAVTVLLAAAFTGVRLLPAQPLAAAAGPVLVAQALLLGLVPAAVAAALAWAMAGLARHPGRGLPPVVPPPP